MKQRLVSALLLASVSTFAYAQSNPFDMTGERPANPPAAAPPAVTPPRAPTPAVPPVAPPATPQVSTPPVRPPVAPQPTYQQPAPAAPTPVQQPASNQATPQAPARPSTAAAVDDRKRFLLPFKSLSLSGETERKQWTIYLTPEQAQTATSLRIGYQNSIVVAPESSNLSVRINNTMLPPSPISSPDGEGSASMPIPPGTLQAGANVIAFAAQQRHRTDCTAQSTYDLWTDINPAETYINFGADVANRIQSIDDISATGLDASGVTTIIIVAPTLSNPAFSDQLLRLSQALALRTQMPNQNVVVTTEMPATQPPGTLTVVVGTTREIAPLAGELPPEALAASFTGFEMDANRAYAPLLVTGPTPQAVQSAIDTLFTAMERPAGSVRGTLYTKAWHGPDTPLVMSDRRIAFSELGIQSSEFSGRRFQTDFMIGVPSDFFADAYGEATLLLDAAYSDEVLPGSQINIYVNGNIASTVPISNNGGGIFRHLPINLTLRHFVPGANAISMEAVLLTEVDKACLPGATASETPRFALFDTSEFYMPNFALLGKKPDLAATSGVGQPYRADNSPVAISLDRADSESLSTAATLVSRLAMSAGHPIPVETVASASAVGDRDAIFVGTVSQMQQALLAQFNITPSSQVSWLGGQGANQNGDNTEVMFDDWRRKVNNGKWQGQISSFEEWMKRNFDISPDTLRFLPSAEESYSPPANVSFMLAQGLSPSGDGVWTMATAPNSSDLRTGMAAISEETRWRKVAGRVTTYDAATDTVQSIPVQQPRFYVTREFSLSNWRLIAANWLSTNVLSYSLAFVGFLCLLGVITTAMLRMMGRRK
jgi:hypothetical protein